MEITKEQDSVLQKFDEAKTIAVNQLSKINDIYNAMINEINTHKEKIIAGEDCEDTSVLLLHKLTKLRKKLEEL